jgi:outer membrane protein TolC
MRHAIAVMLTLASAASAAADVLQLDPDAAVALALEASDRSVAAAARVDAAAERVGTADADRMPTLDLAASAAYRSSVPEAAFPESIPDIGGFVLFPNIQNVYRAGLVVSQPLWTGGAISGSREAARYEEGAATAEAALVAADLRFAARSAYWRAVAAEATLAAARAEADRAERLLSDARDLRAAGMAVRADELGAEARLAAAQLHVIEAGAAASNRLSELRSLLGVPSTTEIELTELGTPLPPAPPAADSLTVEARATRPEIAMLTAQRDALASRSAVVGAPSRPHVSLSAQWDVARPNERYLPLEDAWNTSWSVGVVAGWRLFDGSATDTQVAALDAERAALEADLRELERQVSLSVETAQRNLVAAISADAAASASMAAATAREADSRDRYLAGVATVSEVLDAQTELADAELAQARARSGAWVAEAALRRAIGR